MSNGIPQREIGLGSHVYIANLPGLYDSNISDPMVRGQGNDFVSSVLNAGYRGYINRDQGTIVVLNESVPVEYAGTAEQHVVVQRTIERRVPRLETRLEGSELVRKPNAAEMVQIIGAKPKLAAVAPSFKLQYGEARVQATESTAADQVLREAGSSFQFGDIQHRARDDLFPEEFASKRGNTNSAGQQINTTKQGMANFRAWFDDSAAVDAKGRPLLMYYTTNADMAQFEVSRDSYNNSGLMGNLHVTRAGIFATPNRKFSQTYAKLDRNGKAEDGASPTPHWVKR